MRTALVIAAALILVPTAGGWKTLGTKWHGTTIRYYNLSPGYSWSLEQAVSAWNASGARIRFVPVPRAGAQLLVGARLRPGTNGEAGEASVLTQNRWADWAIVRIDDGLERHAAAQVFAHELGHVLGLDHETRGCSTMNPGLAVDHPSLCRPVARGTWRCGLVTKDDAQGAVYVYGGTARAPVREFCPIQ